MDGIKIETKLKDINNTLISHNTQITYAPNPQQNPIQIKKPRFRETPYIYPGMTKCPLKTE